jgi:hypothetical protein
MDMNTRKKGPASAGPFLLYYPELTLPSGSDPKAVFRSSHATG